MVARKLPKNIVGEDKTENSVTILDTNVAVTEGGFIEIFENKQKELTLDMLDKARDLLKSAADGSGELKIKQIEKAIEIYKAINA